MTGFVEPRPDLVAPNPGGADDPLGESTLDPENPWLRVFEPRDVRLVIGRHQDPERELHLSHARADSVPIHRRVAGGGAVVLAPGMVVVAIRLRNSMVGTVCYFDLINRALAPAVARATGVLPSARGYGDLTVPGGDGRARKILGASLRQTSKLVLYLGALLVEDRVALMERYLQPPSREPTYRLGRDHGAFCTHLGAFSASTQEVCAAVTQGCRVGLSAEALN